MGRMRMEATGKVRIVACRKENVTIKYICQRTKRAKSSIMASLAAARGLPPNVIPDPKARSGRPRKTSTCTNFVIHRELCRNPHLSASELKEMHPDLLYQMHPAPPAEGHEVTKLLCGK